MGAGYAIRARAKGAAEVYIYEDVGEGWFGGVSARQFAQDLKDLGTVDTIDVRINSYGGDVFDGLAIYRQLADHKARVITHIDGVAASIASVIAMAGDEIRISEAGFVMIHDAWGVAIGPSSEMRKMADMLETTSGVITDVYKARTGNERGQLRSWMEEETWFTGAEAVDRHFADAMDENVKMAARALDNGKHQFRHAPANLVKIGGATTPVVPIAPPATSPSAAAGETPNRAAAGRRLEQLRAKLSLGAN